MIIEPKTRGFICTTAHPDGCFEHVRRQVEYARERPFKGPKKVLVIGSSTGYGLATRIAAAFGGGAETLGVAFESPASGKRTATAGWYNTAAFEKLAAQKGLYAKTIIGDAFSREIKNQVIETVKNDFGKIDLLVYSLAAPRRTTETGEKYASVIKPIGAPFTNKTIDLKTRQISEITVEPATEEEAFATVKVMGGEDWRLWIEALKAAGVLAEGFITAAYNYIGPEITHAIYLNGTIGRAKDDLKKTADSLSGFLADLSGKALISVNKALVTQASAAIPVVPLYISILYKIMKQKNVHEGCIEQMHRLLSQKLYGAAGPQLDKSGMLRLDDLEMSPDVQQAAKKAWEAITAANLEQYADIKGYWDDFYNLFGFGFDTVDYEKDQNPDIPIPSLA